MRASSALVWLLLVMFVVVAAPLSVNLAESIVECREKSRRTRCVNSLKQLDTHFDESVVAVGANRWKFNLNP